MKEVVCENINENKIFELLDPKENTILSNLTASDMLEILYTLKDSFKPCKTDEVGIDPSHKFGLEYEFAVYRNCINVNKEIKKEFPEWDYKKDISIGVTGRETSSPVYTDTTENWNNINNLCSALKSRNVKVTSDCALQTHLDATILKSKHNLINFAKYWVPNENIFYRFGWGKSSIPRDATFAYASPVASMWNYFDLNKLEKKPFEKVLNILIYGKERPGIKSSGRYKGVNLTNITSLSSFADKNTIEFRYGNGTLDTFETQNYVLMNSGLLSYVTSDKFDYESIERWKKENVSNYSNLAYYRENKLKQACKVIDDCCINNEQKMRLLYQYVFKEDEDLDIKKLTKKEFH